jgi:hypothetical protein
MGTLGEGAAVDDALRDVLVKEVMSSSRLELLPLVGPGPVTVVEEVVSGLVIVVEEVVSGLVIVVEEVGPGPGIVVDELLDDEDGAVVDVDELEVAVVDSSADSSASESSAPSAPSAAPSARPGPNGLAVSAGSPVFTGVRAGGAVLVGLMVGSMVGLMVASMVGSMVASMPLSSPLSSPSSCSPSSWSSNSSPDSSRELVDSSPELSISSPSASASLASSSEYFSSPPWRRARRAARLSRLLICSQAWLRRRAVGPVTLIVVNISLRFHGLRDGNLGSSVPVR